MSEKFTIAPATGIHVVRAGGAVIAETAHALILTEAGYIDSTRTRKLQSAHIVKPVLQYLEQHNEQYVLRCIQVGT